MTPRACPVCARVEPDPLVEYCPPCRRVHIIVKPLTLQQLNARLEKMRAGAGLVKRAIKALEAL